MTSATPSSSERPLPRGPRAANRPAARRALTLLELLVSIALFAALMIAILAFLSDMLSARERLREVTARDRAATALLEEIERDIASCIVGDARHGAGVSGTATAIEVLRRGVPVQQSSLGFTAGAPLDDIERSTYRFDESAHSIAIGRTVLRDGEPGAEPTPDAPAPDATTLAASLARVRFAYHDGRRWQTSFDSVEAQRLPRAVEVAIWYETQSDVTGDAEMDEFAEPTDLDRGTGPDPLDVAGFDERAFALESDPAAYASTPPDRIRVIAVLDPEPDEAQRDPSAGALEPAGEPASREGNGS